MQFKEKLKRFGSFQDKSKSKGSGNERGRKDLKCGEKLFSKHFEPSALIHENAGIFISNFKRNVGRGKF